MNLNTGLLESIPVLEEGSGDMHAVLNARGLYNTFQFVLELSLNLGDGRGQAAAA
jgi:hypothetical protein